MERVPASRPQAIEPAQGAETKSQRGRALDALGDFMRLFKPGIVGSNTVAALAGFWMARPHVMRGLAAKPWEGAALLAAGSACLIAGACAINNLLDRDLDARMERTRTRPTATGRIPPARAALAGIVAMLLGALLLMMVSKLAAILGLIGAFAYLGPYTLWVKRRSPLSSVVGAVSGSAPPLMGWAAATGRLTAGAWALFVLFFLWQQAHVLALSVRRADDYLRSGLPSPGRILGEKGVKAALAIVVGLLPLPLWLAESKAGLAAVSSLLSGLWLAFGWLWPAHTPAVWAGRMYVASLVWLVAFLAASTFLPIFQTP